MHIKNELEQRVFKENKANVLLALWSSEYKELNTFLEAVDSIAYEKKVSSAYAVNVDRVFLYNEAIQKVLIDKVNTTFLRDTEFSNLNNLFSTRYVRNLFNVDGSAPFVIITDSFGKIAFA